MEPLFHVSSCVSVCVCVPSSSLLHSKFDVALMPRGPFAKAARVLMLMMLMRGKFGRGRGAVTHVWLLSAGFVCVTTTVNNSSGGSRERGKIGGSFPVSPESNTMRSAAGICLHTTTTANGKPRECKYNQPFSLSHRYSALFSTEKPPSSNFSSSPKPTLFQSGGRFISNYFLPGARRRRRILF